MTTLDGKVVKKTEEQYTQEDFVKLSKNCKPMHILYYGLDFNESIVFVHMNLLRRFGTRWL